MLIATDYCQLLSLLSIYSLINGSNGSITTSLLLHYYKQWSITALTAHWFHLITSHYYHYYLLLPHLAVVLAPLLHHYHLITPELYFGCPLLPITPLFYRSNGSITASLLHHYYTQRNITTITTHYFHFMTASLLPLLPITSTLSSPLLHHYYLITPELY